MPSLPTGSAFADPCGVRLTDRKDLVGMGSPTLCLLPNSCMPTIGNGLQEFGQTHTRQSAADRRLPVDAAILLLLATFYDRSCPTCNASALHQKIGKLPSRLSATRCQCNRWLTTHCGATLRSAVSMLITPSAWSSAQRGALVLAHSRCPGRPTHTSTARQPIDLRELVDPL